MQARKTFPRTTIATSPIHVVPEAAIGRPQNTRIRIEPKKLTGGATFDFSRWYGCGMDGITSALQQQIERFIAGQDAELSPSTIECYCTIGIAPFLEYLVLISVAREAPLGLQDINRELIDGYLQYLKASGIATSSQKTKYDKTKAVLAALGRRGRIEVVHVGDEATFPVSPFIGVHRTTKGETPLTRTERKAFAAALGQALAPLFSSDPPTLTSELVTFAALTVALYTGRNTTPILQMSTTCLKPHPKEGTMFLVLYKRRGNSFSKVALRNDLKAWQLVEGTCTVRWNVVALIRRVIELSEPLRQMAPESLKHRLWLFEPMRDTLMQRVAALDSATFMRCIAALVKRAQLVGNDGRPLRINVSRLRKTYVNRIYELLNGDVAATAYASGNSPAVTGNHYLRPVGDAKKNWRFMGEILVGELLSNTLGATEKTPVGQCSNGQHGEYAPKKGEGAICISFLNCVRCSNYVVTGDDLYRLFSFYWRVLAERARIDRVRWDRQFAHIVRLIERDIIAAGVRSGVFKASKVDEAKERARVDPHPFWRTNGLMEAMA